MKKVTTWEKLDKAIYELQERVNAELRPKHVDVFVPMCIGGGTVQAQVSWASIGTVTPTEARDFILAMQDAIEMAEAFEFNGYVIGTEEEAAAYETDKPEEEAIIEATAWAVVDKETSESMREIWNQACKNLCMGETVTERHNLELLSQVSSALDDYRYPMHWTERDEAIRLRAQEIRDSLATQKATQEESREETNYIDPQVRNEWSRTGSYDTIVIDIERPRGDGFMDKLIPHEFLEDLDGWGAARAFADELGLEYDETPGDIGINIAMNRIYDLCREYDAIRHGAEDALSKHGMAKAWARAIDAELVKDEFEYGTKPSWMQSLEFAEGKLAGWEVTVLYVTDKPEED